MPICFWFSCQNRFGTYSTSGAVNSGLDLEMPGPTRFRGNALGHAISSGKVPSETLDERARAMLKLVNVCAASGIKERAEEIELNTPETSSLLRKLASDSITLLKNDRQLLPLSKNKSVSTFLARLKDTQLIVPDRGHWA